MSEAGYTLAEMLAALAILGLTVAGLTEGTRVIGRLQAKATGAAQAAAADRRAETALDGLMAGQGPFVSDGRGDLRGDTSSFEFGCGAGRCGAAIVKDRGRTWLVVHRGGQRQRTALAAEGATFSYADSEGSASLWPSGSPRPQVLTAVLLRASERGGDRTLAAAHLWIEEPRNCVFDAIAQGCRG